MIFKKIDPKYIKMPKITFWNAFVKKLEQNMHIFEILRQNLNFVLNFQNIESLPFLAQKCIKIEFFHVFQNNEPKIHKYAKNNTFECIFKGIRANIVISR